MVLFNILLSAIIVVALMLILVVMVQKPKSGGLSSTFGGSTQVVGGVKKTTDFLERTTWTLGTSLIVLVLLANIVMKSDKGVTNKSKILEGYKEVPAAPAPANTPVVPSK